MSGNKLPNKANSIIHRLTLIPNCLTKNNPAENVINI